MTKRHAKNWAIKGAQAIEYYNAETMGFLADAEGNFYFIEMNTRVQVEQPVAELVTQTDIVKAQILIAAGENLCQALGGMDKGFSFDELKTISTLECRINAEDLAQDFVLTPDKIIDLHLPGGVDSHPNPGYTIPLHLKILANKKFCAGGLSTELIKSPKP